MTTLINGKAYDFAQVVVKALGLNLASVSKIDYEETQDKQNNFGAGKRPVSRGQATIKATASLTISMNDIEAIRDVAVEGSLLQVPAFDIEVSFLNDQKVVTHILKNAEFTNDGVTGAVDDMDLMKDFSLVISHVKYR